MKKSFLISALLLLFEASVLWADPKTLPPALTGYGREDSRLGIVYGKSTSGDAQAGNTEFDDTEVYLEIATTRNFVQGPISKLETYTYGLQFTRLELGTGIGFVGHGVLPNYGLTDPMQGDGFGLHFGIEPVNLSWSVNSRNARQDYFEWEPMGSFGFRYFSGKFHWMLAPRAGGGIGTFGAETANFAWGVGNYIEYAGLTFSFEFIRIQADVNIDRWYFDSTLYKGKRFSFGIAMETLFERLPGSDALPIGWAETGSDSEMRISFAIRLGDSYLPGYQKEGPVI